MATRIGHIGRPHGPYRYCDVRCERAGFLNIYTFRVDTMSYRVEMMDRGNAAVVLPVDFAARTITLIEQPRFLLAFAEAPIMRMLVERARKAPGTIVPGHVDISQSLVLASEMPAGMVDGDETAEEAAVRELFEETGILVGTDKLIHVADYFPSIGGTTERLSAFIADVSGTTPDLTHAGDGDESITVWQYTFDEVFAMAKQGRFRSASMNILLRELRIMQLEGRIPAP
jgi:hypothetical protein